MKAKNQAGAVVDYALARIDNNGDRTTYVGPDHSDLHNDKVVLNQTAPVGQKLYPGQRKSSTKVIRTGISTEGGVAVRRDMRVEILTSHTAGFTDAEVMAAVATAVSIFTDAAQAKAIVYQGIRPA